MLPIALAESSFRVPLASTLRSLLAMPVVYERLETLRRRLLKKSLLDSTLAVYLRYTTCTQHKNTGRSLPSLYLSPSSGQDLRPMLKGAALGSIDAVLQKITK
jgi:hypothetical protein